MQNSYFHRKSMSHHLKVTPQIFGKGKNIYIFHIRQKSVILSTKRTTAQKFGSHKRISRRISQIINDIFG
jgi:hypothetical protein